MVYLLVVDRDPLRASGVAERLKDVPGISIATAKQELGTLRQVRASSPDVVLLGTDDPDSWFLAALVTASRALPIVVYSKRSDPAFVRRIVVTGACDVLPAATTQQELLNALLHALHDSKS